VRLRTVRRSDAAGGRLAGAVMLSSRADNNERLSAMRWRSTSEGAAVNHRVTIPGRENAWHGWGSPNSRSGGLVCTREEAMPGLRARGMVANTHSIFESSVNGSLEAAFANRVRPRTSAWGRKYLDERGEAWRERGRSDGAVSEEKRGMGVGATCVREEGTA
jgi:hypothetical protein